MGEDRKDLRFSLDMAQPFRQIIGLPGWLIVGFPGRVVEAAEFVILARVSLLTQAQSGDILEGSGNFGTPEHRRQRSLTSDVSWK